MNKDVTTWWGKATFCCWMNGGRGDSPIAIINKNMTTWGARDGEGKFLSLNKRRKGGWG